MSVETYKVTVGSEGIICWYQNGKCHRLDGPAVIYPTGTKHWYQNDQLHRLDGPAIEWSDGDKFWYIEGEHLTEKEFNQRIATSACVDKEILIDGKKYKLVEQD